jgi:hypothetical protein
MGTFRKKFCYNIICSIHYHNSKGSKMFLKSIIVISTLVAFSFTAFAQSDGQNISTSNNAVATMDTAPAGAQISISQDTIVKENSKYLYKGIQIKTKQEFMDILKSVPDAESAYRSSKALGVAAIVLADLGGILIGMELGSSLGASITNTERDAIPGLYIGGGISAGIGIALAVVAQSKVGEAVKVYNKAALSSKTTLNIIPDSIQLTQNGVSIGWNF